MFRLAQTCNLPDLEVFVDLVTSEAEVEDGIGLSQSVGDFGDRRPTSEPARDLYSKKESCSCESRRTLSWRASRRKVNNKPAKIFNSYIFAILR